MGRSGNLRRAMRTALCGSALLTATVASAPAATVRGRATCGSNQPAKNSYMTLFNAKIGRSKPAYVGADGTFYLYNIPSGSFVLEGWSKTNPTVPPKVFQVRVFDPYTDAGVVMLPC